MSNQTNFKRGDKVTIKTILAYGKGVEIAQATIVAIRGRVALLDNGQETLIY